VGADVCKATFRLHLDDVHCQQILFGGTADSGYARLLGPFLENETICGRITLLEGPPFARELADIKEKFRTVPFDLFRNQKLSNVKRRVSFQLTPPATPSTDYATAAARASASPSTSIAMLSAPPAAQSSPVVLRNSRGQRVDSILSYSKEDYISLKGRRLCNNFHLLGRCRFLDSFGKCQHEHGERLNPKQLLALRIVARQSPCQWGLNCVDVDCFAGHRCTRDNCVPTTCRFPLDMHNVDTTIVS